ncbi:(-)-alpha-terpineol synthase-like [Actinidia eriantha]|uniref:(-)-alpha-terpineol synthase-like n=1 Tax=Actinidia eriantha TaxID=165200 RepID=UPI00258FDC9D|nr:(-)-alpha-terpineol synthase-like [Actinidia eriantha]
MEVEGSGNGKSWWWKVEAVTCTNGSRKWLEVPTSFYTSTMLTSKTLVSPVKSLRGRVLDTHRCTAVSLQISDEIIVRRSANYQPPIWDYDYVQSLNSIYAGDVYAKWAAKLKEDVKIMFDKVVDPLEGLELIDDLQRLGVFYHFEGEIKRVLESIHNNKYSPLIAEVFNNFKDDTGISRLAFGVDFMPQFGYRRRMATIVNALTTTIDDVYDVYGTLDELILFTSAVERWDITAMEPLPDYMKICFLSLFNSINEMGYDVLKEQGVNIVPYIQKMWADLCKCYLVEGLEAKWYYSGYTPTFQEYMENAWISISAPVFAIVSGSDA